MEETGSNGAGLAIANPATGVTVRAADEDEDGGERDADAVRIELAPGAAGPAEHVHPRIEERFEVVAGAPTFRVEGRERVLSPGRELRVSPGTPHAFRNDADAPAVLRGRTVPESERLGEVVATLFGLAQEGRTDERGRPGLLQAAVGTVVAPVARALGYEATYDRYLSESFWAARTGDDAPNGGTGAGTDE